MKILLLNQAFYPDVVSSAQHASDLAVHLADSGHEVTVISSNRAYDDSAKTFRSKEIWNGVRIRRIGSLGLGKRAKWRRGLDFGSFLFRCTLEIARLPKFDIVIAMTSPPLIAFIASLFLTWKGGKLVYWVMDLNPDEAIAAGWLRNDSNTARILNRMSLYTFRHSTRIVVLDRFMKARVVEKGVDPAKVEVIPPWSHDDAVHSDIGGREEFRRAHGLDGKFVVMYSGNHSPCHPLDSLVEAASLLKDDARIVFCFVGGGSEHSKVREVAANRRLQNVLCLPYQPIEKLSASLNAADLHAVVMGDPFVGIVHPCKIYNILRLGLPVLYIGPSEGHIPDILPGKSRNKWFYATEHGRVDSIVENILSAENQRKNAGHEEKQVAARFSENALLPRLANCIESVDHILLSGCGTSLARPSSGLTGKSDIQ